MAWACTLHVYDGMRKKVSTTTKMCSYRFRSIPNMATIVEMEAVVTSHLADTAEFF